MLPCSLLVPIACRLLFLHDNKNQKIHEKVLSKHLINIAANTEENTFMILKNIINNGTLYGLSFTRLCFFQNSANVVFVLNRNLFWNRSWNLFWLLNRNCMWSSGKIVPCQKCEGSQDSSSYNPVFSIIWVQRKFYIPLNMLMHIHFNVVCLSII